MKVIRISFLLLGMMTAFRLPAQTKNWPAVQPLREGRTFTDAASNSDTPFLVFIKDAQGVAVYKLECHNGNYDDDSEISFSGTFQCGLFGVNGDKPTTWNLLAVDNKDEQSADWFNRGRMLSEQLRGACDGFPEYASLRHFKLRGMLITFQFADLGWSKLDKQNKPELIKFTFDVSVVPDQSAQTGAAEPVKGAKPPKSCYETPANSRESLLRTLAFRVDFQSPVIPFTRTLHLSFRVLATRPIGAL
jgi:hypothetical protein